MLSDRTAGIANDVAALGERDGTSRGRAGIEDEDEISCHGDFPKA
jgi:hypothetical protein